MVELHDAAAVGASALVAGLLLGAVLFVLSLFGGTDSTRGGD